MATPITTKEFFEWTAKTWIECQKRAWSEEGEGTYSTPTAETNTKDTQ